AYPFTVHVRSRSNPVISGAAQGLARVGQGVAVRTAQAGRGRRSLWPLLLLASVSVVALAVVAYLVLGNPGAGASKAGASFTPSPTTVVSQNILPTQTLPPLAAAASPTVEV